MRNTIFKVIIIICFIFMSFLFYKHVCEENEKIATQDIVLDLVDNHDRYHSIYMKQFEGTHNREETKKIVKEVYIKNSQKIINPQVMFGETIIKTEEDLNNIEKLNSYDNFKFTYKVDADVLVIEEVQGLEDNGNE